jgi:hypothetical protein
MRRFQKLILTLALALEMVIASVCCRLLAFVLGLVIVGDRRATQLAGEGTEG